MGTKRRLGAAVGATGVAVLLVRLLVKVNDAARYPDSLKVLAVVVLLLAVVVPMWLAWLFHKARTFKAQLQLAHPGALVVDTFWTGRELGRFLKKGPLSPKAKGTGYVLALVADARGIQLVRPRRRPVYFGLVPWEQVVSVRMETLRRPLERRPMVIIEIDSWGTPYVAVFRLVPSGRQNRETGMDLAEMILAKRPRVPLPEDRA